MRRGVAFMATHAFCGNPFNAGVVLVCVCAFVEKKMAAKAAGNGVGAEKGRRRGKGTAKGRKIRENRINVSAVEKPFIL